MDERLRFVARRPSRRLPRSLLFRPYILLAHDSIGGSVVSGFLVTPAAHRAASEVLIRVRRGHNQEQVAQDQGYSLLHHRTNL
jgi:hypothetical protein